MPGMRRRQGKTRLNYRPRASAGIADLASGVDARRHPGGSVNWLTIICLGAAGGAIVTVVGFCADVFSWQQTRRTAHLKRDQELPTLRAYVDPWPDFVALLTRIV